MRKVFFLLLAMCLGMFLPSNADAWDVCEISVGTPAVALELSFTSSFCICLDEDVITIQITPTNPAVVIDSVVFTKATPHWETNQSWAEQSAITPLTADILLHKVTEKTHTIHLWVYLSTGEHIGVNAQF
jgi:hypothetical protein